MKRITSFLLAIIMLVCLIPADLAYAEGEKKLNVVLLNDGQYLIKLSDVDYAMARQATRKKDINPTDNPDDFEERTITVDISEIVIETLEADGTKVDSVTITVTCGDANYSKEYILTKDKFGEDGGIDVPVPIEDYFPQIYVKFSDGRDSRYLVEAKSKPHQVVNITIDFLGHTGVATRWYGDTTRPDVEANYIGLNKSAHKFTLPKENQNTVLRSPSNLFQWRGYDNIVTIPVVPEADIRANGIETAKKFHLEIQDALQGQLANSKYYYQITGESYTPRGFTATMREKYTVDFDAGDGKWKTAKPAQQFAANGLKLGESFMEAPDTIGPVTVPNGANDLTPPTAEAGKPAKKFVGWSTNKNGQKVEIADYVVTGDVTFYALYEEEEQGRVAVQYVDAEGNAILNKYKIKDEKYPDHAEGNKGKSVEVSKIKEPKFIGYKRTADTIADAVKNKTYETEHIQTVEVKYKKLADIIPEKKNGQDNPDVTPDVKEHYAKVTFQVDNKDSKKAKLQLDGADATSPLVYYVNPVEGKTIAQVASVKALSKDDNLYKVDANDMWTFDPDSISGTDQVISQATDDDGNVVKTEITLTAKVADKTAAKFKDKLAPQDIKVWVDGTDTDGSKIDWKKGVKVKDDAKDRANLVKELESELAKAKAKVEDLGENGTIAQPGTSRNSSKQNLPDGKKGNLKVAFDDGSALVVENQMLYVSPLKVPVKPNEPNQIDTDKLPDDKLAVEFKLGEGVKIGDKEGDKTTPVLYTTYFVKSGTDLKDDVPKVTLKEGYKDAKWYKGDAEATDKDYKVTANAVFTAKATQKGTGTAKLVYKDENDNTLDPITDTKLQVAGQTYNISISGKDGTDISYDKSKAPKILGYVFTNEEPVITPTKFAEGQEATITLKYKKLDDVYKGKDDGKDTPDVPDDGDKDKIIETIKETYVKVKFLADDTDHTGDNARGKLEGTSVYYVNPKAHSTLGDFITEDKTATDKIIVPTITAKDGFKVKTPNWSPDLDAEKAKAVNPSKKELTFTALYEGKPVVVPGPDQPKKPGTQDDDDDDEYVKIEFDKGTGKDLVGTTIYWVLKNSTIKDIKAYEEVPAGKTAKEVVFKIPTALKDGFTWVGWTADKPAGTTVYDTKLSNYNAVINDNVKFTAEYEEKLVRPTNPDDPKPARDEVTVRFLKGEHGTLTGIVLNAAGEEVIAKGKDKLAYNVKKKATWAAMKGYIPTAVADYGWRVANPSWKPILPEDSKLVEKEAKEFTAQYVAKPIDEYITLTLDENYRNGKITDYEVLEGDLIENYLYIPRRRGYIFKGWSYDSRRLEEVRPGDRIYYPTTLYAIWTKQKAKDDEEVEPIDTRAVNEHKAYMFGYTDGSVRPNGSITRAEAAALVTRLLGIEANASSMKPAFTDTPSSWYNKAINAAVARGIMKGYPDGRFRPNAPITRAEFTQMIYTFDNKPYGVAPFVDVKGHWAERAIGSEYQAKRITGYPDGLFRPDANITRAEAVVILNKIFERNYDAMSPINAMNKEKIKVFTDLHTSFWGFNDMVEATNTHLFKRRVKGAIQEDWVEVK